MYLSMAQSSSADSISIKTFSLQALYAAWFTSYVSTDISWSLSPGLLTTYYEPFSAADASISTKDCYFDEKTDAAFLDTSDCLLF